MSLQSTPTAQQIKLSIKDFFFSVNATKYAVSCGFGHIAAEILNGRLHYLRSDLSTCS